MTLDRYVDQAQFEFGRRVGNKLKATRKDEHGRDETEGLQYKAAMTQLIQIYLMLRLRQTRRIGSQPYYAHQKGGAEGLSQKGRRTNFALPK